VSDPIDQFGLIDPQRLGEQVNAGLGAAVIDQYGVLDPQRAATAVNANVGSAALGPFDILDQVQGARDMNEAIKHKSHRYGAKAVHFAGAPTALHIDLLTATDSSVVSFSIWVKATLSTITRPVCFPDYDDANTSNGPALGNSFGGSGAGHRGIFIGWGDQAYNNFLNGLAPMPSDDIWHNICGAANMGFDAGSRLFPLYVDDVAQVVTTNPSPFGGDGDVGTAFTMTFNGVTVDIPNTLGSALDTYDCADYWFAPNVYIDFTQTANRRKFISAAGKPVDLGADGSTPTGTAPAIFLSGDASPTGFQFNKGTGGAFTLTGTLTNATTSPSD